MEYALSPSVKKRVMRKVYGIWMMRMAAPIVFLELPIFLGALYLSAKLIFVERVLENMAASVSGMSEAMRFIGSAFAHTHWETQLVLSVGLIISAMLARDLLRSIRNVSLFLR